MFPRLLLTALIMVVAVLFSSGAMGEKIKNYQIPPGWKFTLPQGEPEDGREVFIQMQCNACHTMQRPGMKLSDKGRVDGPDLTAYFRLPKEYIADSIIRAHTVVAAPGYVVKKGKAGMGKYNHFMTIQELIDLVAFLKQKN